MKLVLYIKRLMRMLRFDWSFIVGYDFFISYRRSDASPYASGLARLLEKADFRCFLDDNEGVPGRPLTDRLRRALLRSRTLVVVASPELPQSPWVPQEIEIFGSTGRDIIPINIQGGLQKALQAEKRFKLLRERDALWIDEREEVGPGSEPSSHVIGKLQKSFDYQKANRRLRLIIGAVLSGLVGLGLAAFWQMRVAQERLAVSKSQALAADARRQAPSELYAALQTGIQAFDIRPSIEAQTALLECLNRAQRIKRILPCDDGGKAVGVTFSSSQPPRLAVASLVYGKNTTRTTVRVVDLDGELLRTVTVSGDARMLAFLDAATLSMIQGDRMHILDVNTGQMRETKVPPRANVGRGEPSANAPQSCPCEQRHPRGERYLMSAETKDRRLYAYTTEANEIIVFDRITGTCDEPLRAHTHNILAMAWSDDGRYLASAGAIADGDSRHGIILWDRKQVHPAARILRDLKPGEEGVTAISRDGASWLCAGSQSILWDDKSIPVPEKLAGASIRFATLREDGSEAAIADGEGNLLRLRKTANGIEMLATEKSPLALRGLFYSGTHLVGVDVEGRIRMDGLSPAVSARLQGKREVECVGKPASSGKVALVERDPNGLLFAAVIDLETGNECRSPVKMSDCGSFAYSPEKNLSILTSSDYEPAIIAALDCSSQSRQLLNPLRSESGLPTVLSDVAISADAKRMFARSDGRDLALFDLPSQRLLGVLATEDTSSLDVSRDGTRAVSVSHGRLIMWNLQPSRWKELSADLVGGGKSAVR